ncbi:MAG: D-glycerate dehydrogenase, partial [Elusimicrobia bacterium]|nr:D-glycerate dehydrogenase [Elusimicrobiota bacterium]
LCLLTDRIDGKILDGIGKQLKIVANYAVGFNNINLEDAKKRKIMVTNTPGPEISRSVAEHTVALILACAKRIAESDRYTRAKKYKGWAPMLFLGSNLYGKTLGIVGLGAIGAEVAKMMSAFDMKIVYYDIKRNPAFEKKYKAKYAKIPALLKQSDFVTLHVPLLPSTKYLINDKEFGMMKKTAFLINTSRGPIVREKALLKALKAGKIAGAGLDVFECEPAIDCDLTDKLELRKMENVVLTPHTASAAIETRSAMAETAAKNIISALSGKKPPNLVK